MLLLATLDATWSWLVTSLVFLDDLAVAEEVALYWVAHRLCSSLLGAVLPSVEGAAVSSTACRSSWWSDDCQVVCAEEGLELLEQDEHDPHLVFSI